MYSAVMSSIIGRLVPIRTFTTRTPSTASSRLLVRWATRTAERSTPALPTVERGARGILDDHCVIAQPDRSSVASDDPVLERPARVAGREDPIVVSEDPLAILGVEKLEEEVGIAKPLVR